MKQFTYLCFVVFLIKKKFIYNFCKNLWEHLKYYRHNNSISRIKKIQFKELDLWKKKKNISANCQDINEYFINFSGYSWKITFHFVVNCLYIYRYYFEASWTIAMNWSFNMFRFGYSRNIFSIFSCQHRLELNWKHSQMKSTSWDRIWYEHHHHIICILWFILLSVFQSTSYSKFSVCVFINSYQFYKLYVIYTLFWIWNILFFFFD